MKMPVAMPEPFRAKIKRRLLIAFLALALIPLLVATWVAVDRGRIAIHGQARTLLGIAADGAEYQVREYLAHLNARTLDLVSDVVIRDGLDTLGPCEPAAGQACEERRRTLAAELSAYLASEVLPLLPRAVELFVMDASDRKRYNDTHGHARGDAVLQQVAELLRSRVRETDVVARYGGEEFTVLLPETPKAIALQVAEKIRAAVEAQSFVGAQPQPGGRLTISLGVATFPDDITNAQALLQTADQALYRAKNAGRNQVRGG